MNSSPRSPTSATIQADDFVSFYYRTAFGDAYDRVQRMQTPFSAAIASSPRSRYSDQYSPVSTPSPELSSLPSLHSEWDTPEIGLPTWSMESPLSPILAFEAYDIPTPPYRSVLLPQFTYPENFGISPSLISPGYHLADLPFTTVTESFANSASPEFGGSSIPSASYDVASPMSSPSTPPPPPPSSPPISLYSSDEDADGETDDEFTPEPDSIEDAEDDYIPKSKAKAKGRPSKRKAASPKRIRSSASPRSRSKPSPRPSPRRRASTSPSPSSSSSSSSTSVPKGITVTAARLPQQQRPFTPLTVAEKASRECPICGKPFMGSHGVSDLRRHYACHFHDSDKYVCDGVSVESALDFGLDPNDSVMFEGEPRCGQFCGNRFSRRDALLRHLKNTSKGCITEV